MNTCRAEKEFQINFFLINRRWKKAGKSNPFRQQLSALSSRNSYFCMNHWSKATHVHSLQTGKVAHTAGQKQKKTGS